MCWVLVKSCDKIELYHLHCTLSFQIHDVVIVIHVVENKTWLNRYSFFFPVYVNILQYCKLKHICHKTMHTMNITSFTII
jgi:hypothetical protein